MKYLKLILLLSLLGAALAACEKEEPTNEVPLYGVPTVTFSVEGRITDGKGGAIEGINVKFRNDAETYTDVNGFFEFKHCRTFGTGGDQFGEYLVFRDVDGAENGSYKNDKTYVIFTRQENVKFGGNYYGDYRAHPIGLYLTEKTDETEETEE